MFSRLALAFKAGWNWVHRNFVFWEDHQFSRYTVECHFGHQTVLSREEVMELETLVRAQVRLMELDAELGILRISTHDCPHPDCVAREVHSRLRREDFYKRLA